MLVLCLSVFLLHHRVNCHSFVSLLHHRVNCHWIVFLLCHRVNCHLFVFLLRHRVNCHLFVFLLYHGVNCQTRQKAHRCAGTLADPTKGTSVCGHSWWPHKRHIGVRPHWQTHKRHIGVRPHWQTPQKHIGVRAQWQTPQKAASLRQGTDWLSRSGLRLWCKAIDWNMGQVGFWMASIPHEPFELKFNFSGICRNHWRRSA